MLTAYFPIGSLEKYTDLIQQKRYSYIVYYFDQKKEELEIIEKYNGNNENKLTNANINCYICTRAMTPEEIAGSYEAEPR